MRILHNKKTARLVSIAAVAAVMAALLGAFVWISAGESQAQGGEQPGADGDAAVATAALWVSTHASALVAENNELTNLNMTRDNSLAEAGPKAAQRKAELQKYVSQLRGMGYDDRVDRIADLVARLSSNTDQIIAGRPNILPIFGQTAQLRQDLVQHGFNLIQAGNISADSHFYELMDEGIWWSYQNDTRRQVHLDLVSENALSTAFLVSLATTLGDPRAVGIVEDSYLTASNRLRHSAEYLKDDPGSHLHPDLLQLSAQLLDIGDQSFTNVLEQRRQLLIVETRLLDDNWTTLELLLGEVEALIAVTRGETPQPVPTLEQLHSLPGVTNDGILFGQSAALSGPSSALGQGMKLGIEAAFAEANQNGGVHGRQLYLTTQDDAYESQWAFGQTLFLSNQVFSLIGAVGTPTSLAAVPLAQVEGIPFIGPFTGANFLRESDMDNVINYRASYYQETEQMVERLTRDLGVTRVAVLYQDDSYGLDGLEGARRALARRNLEPVATGYYTRNTSAVKRAAVRIVEARPEAVIIIGSYQPAAAAITLLRERLEPDPVFMAVSFVGTAALADELGEAGAGVYVTQVTPLPDDTSSQAVANYRTALAQVDPDAEPGFVSLEGYLAGRMAVAGLEACGPELSRECFLNALQNAGTVNIDDIMLRFGPDDNQGSDAVRLTVLDADGNYHQVDRVERMP